MSIDLKALRSHIQSWGSRDSIPMAGAFVTELLDRLEAAERERDELRAEIAPYRAIAADAFKQLERQILYGTSELKPAGLMSKDRGEA